MTFKDIASETRIPTEEVEHLVMKALSLGLIKGYIDQVDEVVMVRFLFCCHGLTLDSHTLQNIRSLGYSLASLTRLRLSLSVTGSRSGPPRSTTRSKPSKPGALLKSLPSRVVI